MIPRILHHVWVGGDMPAELAAYRETWQATHPEWEHRLWTDSDLGWLENRALFDAAADIVPERNIGQFRANLARYEILHRHGGVYVDCDMESLKPLDSLVDLDAEAWVAWEHEPGEPKGPLVGNTIMAAAPGSLWMRRLIDQVRPDTVAFAGEPSWKMSGPAMLTRLHESDDSDHLVLPGRWFYPYPTELTGVSHNYGDAFCVHHWAHRRGRRRKAFPAPVSAWPPKLSVAIMAHPSRSEMVADIVDRLDVEPTIVWDEGRGLWDTARRAWLAHDLDATHHLVLQDDVVPCQDLIAGLTRAVEQVPTSPISAFVMRYRVKSHQREQYQSADGAWWLDRHCLSAQAILLPVVDIAEMVKHGDRYRQHKHDDMKIRDFYRRRKVQVWNTVPSLVQHLDLADGNPTLLAGNDRPERGRRVAIDWIGADRSALEIDWSTEGVQ